MPLKYTLTWADMHVNEIRKVALKKERELTSGDKFVRTTAIIIASFSSRHSWETHKCTETDFGRLNSNAIRDEYATAATEKWKQVSFFDISEIASEHLPDKTFYRWLFMFVDGQKHKEYKAAWTFLKEKLTNYSDEPASTEAKAVIVSPVPAPQHALRHKVQIKRKQLAKARKG